MALAIFAPVALFVSGTLSQGPASVTTSFKPSIDLPVVRNSEGQYQAIFGMCNGIDELSQVYYRFRVANNAPGLNDITDLIAKNQSGGNGYLKKLLETATYKSLNQGQPHVKLKEGLADPQGFSQRIVDRIAANKMPVSIGLGGPVNHRVTVYGADLVDGQWVLRVADPNYVGAVGDTVRLKYDSGLKAWRSEVNGRPSTVWTGAGIVQSAINDPNEYLDLMQMGLQGTKINEIRTKLNVSVVPRPPTTPKRKVVLSKDAKVGGVSIQFDPELFTTNVNEAQLAAMEERARQFLESDEQGVLILEPTVRTLELALVPLEAISPKSDLGGLTRVLGFVARTDGSLVLVGRRESGVEPIPADVLAVALQSIYAHGASPYVSLDPPVGVAVGPQTVRVGGLEPHLRNTRFTKMLLDADYEMKKVNLGKLQPPVPGFRRWIDLMSESSTAGWVRMWLSPLAAPVADAYICRKDGGVAVLFESQVQVLSAQDKLELAGVNVGVVDDVAKRAADQFTLHFDEIAKTCPNLGRLRGVFDIAKLCAALRSLKFKSSQLEPWLTHRPAAVPLPASYPAIGPDWSPNGMFLVTGGAIADPRFGPECAVATESLQPLFASGKAATVTLPSTMSVADSMAAAFQARSQMAQALRNLRDGLPEAALEAAERVLQFDPADEQAGILRGIALIAMGRFQDAIAGLDSLAAQFPAARALRAGARAELGDNAGAVADAKSAAVRGLDNEGVLILSALALVQALALDDAKIALAQLRMVSPSGPANSLIADRIARMENLGHEKARERIRLIAKVPLAVQAAAFSAKQNRPEHAFAVLRDLESGIYSVPAELHVPELLRFSIAMYVSANPDPSKPEVLKSAQAGAAKLIEDHPNWSSAHLAQAALAYADGRSVHDVVRALRNAAVREPAGDPIMDELKGTRAIDPFALGLAAVMLIEPGTAPDHRTALASLIEEVETNPIARRFLREMRAQPGFDLLDYLRGGGNRESSGVTAARFAALDRITQGCEKLDARHPIFSLALAACTIPVGLSHSELPEYGRLMDRALALAQKNPAPHLLESQIQSLRGLTWLNAANAIVQSHFRPGSAMVKTIDSLSAKLDRLAKPASKRDSMAAKRKTLAEAYSVLSALPGKIRPAIAGKLASIRQSHGAATADRVTFCIAMMQELMGASPPKKLEDVAKVHPGIEKTAEFKRLNGLYGSLKRVILDADIDVIWRRILAGFSSRSDGLSVCKMLKATEGLRFRDASLLGRYATQARAQAEFGQFPAGR